MFLTIFIQNSKYRSMRYRQEATKEKVLGIFQGTEVFTLQSENFEEMRAEARKRTLEIGVTNVDLLDEWNTQTL